ncbi:hypothetical protein LXL04_031025 [Taraxacum kok-saghyz]
MNTKVSGLTSVLHHRLHSQSLTFLGSLRHFCPLLHPQTPFIDSPKRPDGQLSVSVHGSRTGITDHFSCIPISKIHTESSPKHEPGKQDDDDLWLTMINEAKSDLDEEPILSDYYSKSILSHDSMESALSHHLSTKLGSSSLPTRTLHDLFIGVLTDNQEILKAVKDDLRAVKERDPACFSYVHCFLHFKGFLACQAHRIAHKLWLQNRRILAVVIQNRVSEVLAMDIHPGAKIGSGILFDHATGVVVGETAVIGDNVSILHNVTLGGTGKIGGDRHPKIGDGVLIGAGTCVLGNVRIGEGAKIGAGSVVVKDLPARTTAVGNPAKLIGGKDNPVKLDKIPSHTMDHTSHIEFYDYCGVRYHKEAICCTCNYETATLAFGRQNTELPRKTVMEPTFLSFQIIFSFLIFICMLLRLSKTKNSNLCLPPGPWKLPIIGNLHHLGSSLPHQRLTHLAKKYGPLMHLQLGQLSMIVVSSPETAKEVLKTHDVNFSNRPFLYASSVICNNVTNLTFAPYGDYWRRVRKICSMELLSPMRVQSFRSVREEEVLNFVNSISKHVGFSVNLSERIFSLTYGITARVAFGKKCKDEGAFIELVKEASVAAAGFNVSDLYPSSTLLPLLTGFKAKLEKIRGRFDEIVGNIIEEHEAKRVGTDSDDDDVDEDLVDVLLKFREHGDGEFSLSIANIKTIILDIFTGGSETSSTTVEWAMFEMLKHPTIMKKAQTEIRQVVNRIGAIDDTCLKQLVFLKLIIKETLRLHPPAPLLLPRESRERCEINGYEIPEKTKVIVNAWAIGRDPMWWKDPERFHPERFLNRSIDYSGVNNFEYVPFGGGRRVCPGMTFGLANVELPLVNLLYHFDWKLPRGLGSEDFEMNERFGVTVRRKGNLILLLRISATHLRESITNYKIKANNITHL